MRFHRELGFFLLLLIAAAFGASAAAQQGEPQPPSAAPAPARHAAKPNAHARMKPPAAAARAAKPALLGQYGKWDAYTASPGGKKICFAIAKPVSAETKPPNRPRDQPYMFVTTRPADKVTNEISIAIGYPLKPGSEASAQVGTTTYALYTEGDGAWIKDAAEEAHMVDAMRAGDSAVVKGVSTRGTETTDTYSLEGFPEALDRVGQECK